MIKIAEKYKTVLLESIEDQMYKQSLLLEKMKGGPMNNTRKALTKKQALLEELQHVIHLTDAASN